MKVPVIRRVTQPPSGNLIHIVQQRIEAVRRNPKPLIPDRCRHPLTLSRSFHQWTHIANWERVKVRNTLIEYMTTRYLTDPPVRKSMRNAIPPMKQTPQFPPTRSAR